MIFMERSPEINVRFRLIQVGKSDYYGILRLRGKKYAFRFLPRFPFGSKSSFAKRRDRKAPLIEILEEVTSGNNSKVKVKSILKTLGVSKAKHYNYVPKDRLAGENSI